MTWISLAHKNVTMRTVSLSTCLSSLMLMCADLLQTTKCLTQCLKNQSHLRWLALRPLVQTNRQTTSLALKGWDQTQWVSLCCAASHLHFDISSRPFLCNSCIDYLIKSSTCLYYGMLLGVFSSGTSFFCLFKHVSLVISMILHIKYIKTRTFLRRFFYDWTH